jgi:hypothetical protein
LVGFEKKARGGEARLFCRGHKRSGGFVGDDAVNGGAVDLERPD